MRLHRLRLTAFGSFPGEEEVDFDALGAAGLFLVHGPTGAGKTTVLDAVCYALYGRVPGHRDSARSLRCDHAPTGRGPSVELEFTLRGRRLRVTRSPAWHRPKLKGEGLVEEKPKVVVAELTGGEWVGRTRRLDEAGHLLGGLLGMSADQFWQVAMLPQGDFARFLRATGEERGKLLKHLFSVQVFTDAESWLADHRTRMGRERQELAHAVDVVIKRMEEAAGDHLLSGPPALTAPKKTEPEPDPSDDPLGWADRLTARAAALLAEATATCTAGETAVRQATERLDGARALADRRRRYAEALARQALLEETAEERSELETILDEAARADRVLPLAQAVTQRSETATKSARLAADALARIPFATAVATAMGQEDDRTPSSGHEFSASEPERLSALERERRDEIARLGELRGEELRLRELREEREGIERELAAWTTREEEVTARLDALPEERRAIDEELRAARLAAARLPAAEAAYRRAVELSEATSTLEQAQAALPDGVGDLERAARDRLDEIARLEALRDDEIRLDEVETRLAELEAETVTLTAQRESARTALAGLPERLTETRDSLAEARSEAARVPAGQALVDAARARLDAARRRDALTAELDAAEQERRDATDRAQQLRDRLQDIRQARIDGMAAELASHLRPGEACVVCGSPHHPAPAAPSSSAATADDEAAAQARYDEADAARQDAEHRCAALAGQLEQATALAGSLTVPEAADALHHAETELAGLLAAAEKEPDLAARAEELQRELDAAEARSREIEALLAEHRTLSAGLTAERDRLSARLKTAQAEDGSVTARKERLTAEADVIHSAIEAAARADQARTAYDASRTTIDDDLATALDQALHQIQTGDRTPDPALDRAATGDRDQAHDAAESGGQIPDPLKAGRAHDPAPATPTTAERGETFGIAGPDRADDAGRSDHRAGAGDGDDRAEVRGWAEDRVGVVGGVGNQALAPDRSLRQAHDQAYARALEILERLRESAARETELADAAQRLEAEAARLGEEAAELARRLAVGRARRDELDADIARIGEVLERARGADATLAARLDRLSDEADLLREAADAVRLARSADAELASARERAEEAAIEAGFDRLADAEAAVRTPEEREAMAERLRALDAEQAAVALLLEDPELVAAAAEPEPDLAALESALREAADAHQASASARDEASRRHERLVALRRELDEACGKLRPAEARYELAKRMAELVGGTSADNPLHIKLSSYVLGERLSQVVDAANERLEHMSAGRYLLLYDQRRSAGDRRKSGGGLGLRVLDGWTGVDRDPATLSGGESFITALALALGLADVVTAEAGGVEIGTLFVDEGFGTLDEDTLDGVLDILDGLRSGGRTVGIVSHVAELRTRIQAQLRVEKGRTGSTLRVRTPG